MEKMSMLAKLSWQDLFELDFVGGDKYKLEIRNRLNEDVKLWINKEAFGTLLDELNEIYGEMSEDISHAEDLY